MVQEWPRPRKREIYRQGSNVAALAAQKRRFPKAVDIVGHLGVKTGTGDGQGAAAVALNGVQGELRAVPEVFRIAEQRDHISEIFQKIIACPDRDAGHGGIFSAHDTIGHFIGGAVAAAGVEADIFSRRGNVSRDLCCVTFVFGEDTVHRKMVAGFQTLGHLHQLYGAVPFSRSGVDNKYMSHGRPSCSLNFNILTQYTGKLSERQEKIFPRQLSG